jgi:hypothetical protein
MAFCNVAIAGEEKGDSKLKAQPFVMPYIVVLFCIGGGMFLVCLSSKRRDRPKDAEVFRDDASALVASKKQVPVVLMGMRDVKVDKMLGKPKVKRRGAEIYAELAQAGQLSDEEAAKVHAIYDHPAGRYEIVYLDRRVVEIKRQPEPKPEE